MYLESFIENTASLPPEIQRILNTIKALDEKCIGLSYELQGEVQVLLQLPPQYSNPSYQAEYNEVNDRVARMQKMLQQFSDEKVILAQQAHDMLEAQALELERTMHDLGEELKKSHPDFSPLDFNAEALGLESSRYKKYDDWTTTLTTVELGLTTVPGSAKKAGSASVPKPKRPKEEEGGAGGFGSATKKKSSTLIPQDSFDDISALAPGRMEEPEIPIAFIRAPPPGFKPSAAKPQAVGGQFQTEADISTSLVGRHAELFWPDDNLWYLIEIQDVDVANRTARVIYITGETEDLSLEETANDRHMVLVPL